MIALRRKIYSSFDTYRKLNKKYLQEEGLKKGESEIGFFVKHPLKSMRADCRARGGSGYTC